jgi:hypothetical protein
MARSAKQVYRLTGREAMYSPGARSLRHEIERRFWQQIATGITSEKAAEAIGVSQAVGSRWFRYRGGMPLFMSKPVAGRYLSFAEREEIALLSVQGLGVREIADILDAIHQPFRESSRATRRHVMGVSSIVLRSRSGRRNGSPNDQNQRSWQLMHVCANTFRITWRAKYVTPMVVKLPGPDRHRSRGEISHIAVTESGLTAGHLNKLLIGCRLISRMMSLCVSLTKPFIKRSIFKGAARSSASWWVAFAPGARCAFPGRERVPGLGRTSARR